MNSSNLTKLLLFAFLFLILLKPVSDPDFGWHLSQGQWMLAHRQVINQDILTWTFSGKPWSDFYWLTEVGIAYLYDSFGPNSLSIIFSLLVSGVVWLLVRRAKIDVFSYLAILGATVIVSAFSGVRPQVLSWGYIIFLFYLLNRLSSWGGYVIPLLFLLWANTHISFTLGLGTLLLFSLITIARIIRKNRLKLSVDNKRTIKTLGLVNITSFAATLINPYGIALWQTVLRTINSPLDRDNIMEYASINFHSILAWVFLVWVILWWGSKGIKKDLKRNLLILPWLLLSLYSVRFIPVFVLLTLSGIISRISSWEGNGLKKLIKKEKILNLARVYMAVFTIVLAIQLLSTTVWQLNTDKQIAQTLGYPLGAIQWLNQNYKGERIYNQYDWGGYLAWKAPSVKTFINGRMPSWQSQGRNIFKDYLTLIQVKPGWEDVISHYGINMVLVKEETPLAQLLKSQEWKIEYNQNNIILYTKD